MDFVFFRGFVGRAPDTPLETSGTEQLVPMNKRVSLSSIKLWDNCLPEVFELNLRISRPPPGHEVNAVGRGLCPDACSVYAY